MKSAESSSNVIPRLTPRELTMHPKSVTGTLWLLALISLIFWPEPEPIHARNPDANTPAWQTQTLEVRGNTGQFVDLALDAQGDPHLSYHYSEGLKSELRYAYWDGLNWIAQTVDNEGQVGKYTAIALDSNGRPHISYHSDTKRALKYTRLTEAGWVTEIVSSGENVHLGHFTSLVLDSANRAHISYQDVTNGRLVYVYRAANGWLSSVIDAGPNVGRDNQLAFAQDGSLHVSYYDDANGDLKYATLSGNTWSTEVVDSSDDVGRYTALAFDNQNRPHISYVDMTRKTLKYATHNGSHWTTITVPGTGQVEGQTTIALDSKDLPHIGFYGGGLKHAFFKESWQIETVDTGSVGRYTALALDVADTPHFAFYDTGFSDLKYAVWKPPWQHQQVVGGGGSVQHPSLAVRNGRPGISYHNTGSVLFYAEGRGHSWQQNFLSVFSFWPSALAFNSAGQPRIADYSPSFTYGFHSRDGNGLWAYEVAAQLPQLTLVGQTVDLTVAGDTPTVAYVQELGQYPNTSQQVRLASKINDTWQVYSNTAGPTLKEIGQLSADILQDGSVVVSYYDQDNTALRLAIWDGAAWADALIDGGDGVDVGRYNAVATGINLVNTEVRDVIALAYYDATHQAIKYAHNTSGNWVISNLAPGVGLINSLDLALADSSPELPYIAYGDQNAADIKLVYSNDNLQTITMETVADEAGPSAPSQVSLTHDNQPRIAYRSSGGGLVYAFPTARNAVPAPVHHAVSGGVGAVAGFGKEGNCLTAAFVNFPRPSTLIAVAAPRSDSTVLAFLTSMFAKTTQGQTYIRQYNQYAAEMVAIGLADPSLTWDGYRTLQNFMPGLQALVEGRGEEVTVTQQQVDHALSIWQRMATQAGPELAAVINDELAKSNNLQDFVGMTFNEWATAIGVDPTGAKIEEIFLPVVLK